MAHFTKQLADKGSTFDIEVETGSHPRDISVTTPRLSLRPVTLQDKARLAEIIFSDMEVLRSYNTSPTIINAFESWCKQWEDGNPFSPMTVRNQDGVIVGLMIIGVDRRKPGTVEVGFMFGKEYWGKIQDGVRTRGYGKDAVVALTCGLFPELHKNGIKAGEVDIANVVANVKPINNSARNILIGLGMKFDRAESDSYLWHYKISIAELAEKKSIGGGRS